MNKTKNRIGLTLSASFVFLLFLPSAQYIFRPVTEGSLYGYVDNKSVKPDKILAGWVHKDFQKWWADNFASNVGFKNLFVRGFNEVNFRMFSEAPRVRLYATKEHGLYSKMSIESLNYEFANQKALSKTYSDFSEKIFVLQEVLGKNGKRLEVVISSSKAYVHPDGLGERFLENTDSDIFSRVASLGRELERHNVNVVDSGPILRELFKRESIETHPYSGVHWNYYAGCIVAREILSQSKQFLANAPTLHCGNPIYKEPTMVDVDGLMLLNVLSNANIIKASPYPSPAADFINGYKPNILLVGDSFMDQIIFSFNNADSYSQLISSSYFRTREVRRQAVNGQVESVTPSSEEQIKLAVLDDALSSDLIILQMVDYNISRFGYGFVEALLKHISEARDGAVVRVASVTGAYGREAEGNNWWHWVERKINFGLQPTFLPENAMNTRIHLEFSTRGKQKLKLILIGKNGAQKEVVLNGDGITRQRYDGVLDMPPKTLVTLSVESSSEPTVLGKDDQRKTNFLVSNLVVGAE